MLIQCRILLYARFIVFAKCEYNPVIVTLLKLAAKVDTKVQVTITCHI